MAAAHGGGVWSAHFDSSRLLRRSAGTAFQRDSGDAGETETKGVGTALPTDLDFL